MSLSLELYGFTFTQYADGTDNIQSVLSKRDNKSLSGIVRESRKLSTMKKYSICQRAFMLKVLDQSTEVYVKQKAPKKYKKTPYSPCIHNVIV